MSITEIRSLIQTYKPGEIPPGTRLLFSDTIGKCAVFYFDAFRVVVLKGAKILDDMPQEVFRRILDYHDERRHVR